MNKRITLTAAAVILAGSSVTASAYWGGPFSGWGDDFFGDGFFDFNFSASAHGNGWGRGYGYDNPYWGHAPYGAYGAPYALTAEQQQALTEQQQKAMETHQAQLAQMVEEQRKFAEQFAKGDFDPMANMPEAFEDPMAPPLPEAMKSRMEQAKADREARMKVVAERREAMIKEMEQRRASITPVSFQAPMYREAPKTTY